MIRHYFNPLPLLTIVLLVLLTSRCAQVAPLTGGARDTTAPKLMEAIPAPATTNFISNVIVLKFNEYVQLKDLKNQLLISPKLKTEPEIEAQGKKIKITLKSAELQPNTTYKIYFGKAIADMTESNPINGFEYVFSTGNTIDSLKLAGTIKEAFNDKPAADLVVGLYTQSAAKEDSAAFKTEPDYITRTNTDGNYSFSNLPDKTFNIVAFSDKNKNKLYDGESEKIAFKSEAISPLSDSVINLNLFQEDPTKTFLKKKINPSYGTTQLIYNQKGIFEWTLVRACKECRLFETSPGIEKDTVILFYQNITDTLPLVIKNIKTGNSDTLKLPLPKNTILRKKSLGYNSNLISGNLGNFTEPQFTFFSGLDTLKTRSDKLFLVYLKDSELVSEPLKIRYSAINRFSVLNQVKEGINYKIKMDTAAFYDLNGRYNDSVSISFKRQNKSDLGNLSLKVLLNKKQTYIVQLLNDKDVVVREDFLSFSLSSSNAANIDFIGVSPGVYKIKVVFDDNGDKKWNTGNYLNQKQPEGIFISTKQIKIIPDWDTEEEIIVK